MWGVGWSNWSRHMQTPSTLALSLLRFTCPVLKTTKLERWGVLYCLFLFSLLGHTWLYAAYSGWQYLELTLALRPGISSGGLLGTIWVAGLNLGCLHARQIAYPLCDGSGPTISLCKKIADSTSPSLCVTSRGLNAWVYARDPWHLSTGNQTPAQCL